MNYCIGKVMGNVRQAELKRWTYGNIVCDALPVAPRDGSIADCDC